MQSSIRFTANKRKIVSLCQMWGPIPLPGKIPFPRSPPLPQLTSSYMFEVVSVIEMTQEYMFNIPEDTIHH